jgi:hypothetical protein
MVVNVTFSPIGNNRFVVTRTYQFEARATSVRTAAISSKTAAAHHTLCCFMRYADGVMPVCRAKI